MPNGWVHAVNDLLAFGRSYFDLHQAKDKPHETLGSGHRIVGHDWYQKFGEIWTLSDPFPEQLKRWTQAVRDAEGAAKAEQWQARGAHDYWDKIWNELSPAERKYREGFFAWVLFQPKVLRNKFGVDVLDGWIQREIKGKEIWESCPQVKSEYRRLLRYVRTVVNNDKELRDVLNRYGALP